MLAQSRLCAKVKAHTVQNNFFLCQVFKFLLFHSMSFRTFDGKMLMAVHHHEVINGKYHRDARLFEVDLSGDKLVVGDFWSP